jgi:hypothetical protein
MIEPTDGDVINSTIRVSAGDSEQGNRRYDTPFTDAVGDVDGGPRDGTAADLGRRRELRPVHPDLCVPPFPPDLDCSWAYARGESHITVRGSDPHGVDGNNDGVGCESP